MSSRLRVVLGLLILTGFIPKVNASESEGIPTYSRDIAPLMRQHCQVCHRPGQIAPMSLMNFEEARPWAKSIREAVSTRTMPPWHAAPGVREYKDEAAMTEEEIALFLRWVDGGTPEGDRDDLPEPAMFNDTWQLGEPDLIAGMSEPYHINAVEEIDVHRCFVIDLGRGEDTWLGAVEMLPGNRKVAHHLALFLDPTGRMSRKLDAEDPEPGYECFGSTGGPAILVAGYAPGGTPKVYPPGVGFRIPARGTIVMQMHYHATGEPESDLSRVGLHFRDGEGLKEWAYGFAGPFNLAITPGDANFEVTGQRRFPKDITIYSAGPHMHYLGKSMEIWAERPDGSRVGLINVPRWDFNWQREYDFVEPLELPAGSTVKMRAVFDNSAENPFQHTQPPQLVKFGAESTDEMAIAAFSYTVN